MNAGKGDHPRPVKRKLFDANFDQIDWPTKRGLEIRPYVVKKGKKIYKYGS